MFYSHLSFALICPIAFCPENCLSLSKTNYSPHYSYREKGVNIDSILHVCYIKYFLQIWRGYSLQAQNFLGRLDVCCHTSAVDHSWSNTVFYHRNNIGISHKLAWRTFFCWSSLFILFAFLHSNFSCLLPCRIYYNESESTLYLLKERQPFPNSEPSQCSAYACTNDLLKSMGFSMYMFDMTCWTHFYLSMWIYSFKLQHNRTGKCKQRRLK